MRAANASFRGAGRSTTLPRARHTGVVAPLWSSSGNAVRSRAEQIAHEHSAAGDEFCGEGPVARTVSTETQTDASHAVAARYWRQHTTRPSSTSSRHRNTLFHPSSSRRKTFATYPVFINSHPPPHSASYSAFSQAPTQRTTHVGHSTAVELKEHGEPKLELPFYFDTGFALFAKRRSKPFPPPFLSLPSGSFSEPLSTHDKSQDRRPHVNNEVIRGVTNGDDAVLVETNFVGANDGVGQWATRPRGHAALWSRLILHFWAREVEAALLRDASVAPNLVSCLHTAYEATKEATAVPEWHGTTTACSALLHHLQDGTKPLLYVTNLGDSQIMVVRPVTKEVLYKTAEQWHWFDCPRQLGTNSPDTPEGNAVCDAVEVQEGDVVLAMSDGVPDNLWEHEITENVFTSLEKLNAEPKDRTNAARAQDMTGGGMMWVAEELVKATRTIAEDPFAESPYMERAVEEGLAIEGGKMDDISVVAAICRKREG